MKDMKTNFYPVAAEQYSLPQDDDDNSFDQDFDKFNNIQQFNFADLRGENNIPANYLSVPNAVSHENIPETITNYDVISSQKSSKKYRRPVGKPPKSLRSNKMSSFKSIKSSPGVK